MTTWTTSTGKHGENIWATNRRDLNLVFEDSYDFPQNIHELRRTPEGRKILVDQGVSMKGYKRGKGKFASTVPFTERRFVSWDGEGDPDNSSYFLFGSSDGNYIHNRSLGTAEILGHIIGNADIDAIHIGFAFGYDVNNIIRDLSRNHLRILGETGRVQWGRFLIHYLPKKWMVITDRHIGKSVKIWDVWSFFMTSAIQAMHDYKIPVPDIVIEGKKNRGLGYEHLQTVLAYWREENRCYVELVTSLRDSLHAAGLFISAWHGPGAIASYSNRKHHVDKAMATSPHDVGLASQFAYGGGRFEMFKVGRAGQPVYEYDINSAYPFAISQLPNLAKGRWVHRLLPEHVGRFGVYRISFAVNPATRAGVNLHRAMPFLHRDERGTISFPCVVDTWVWSPELWGKTNFPGLIIHEGWEFEEDDPDDRPFSWLAENYRIRQLYKKAGNQAQYALKLQMNSMYGKMAQRVGWNERLRTPPKWHQLEWAGWTTSYCRAMVFKTALFAGSSLVAFETDAVFSSVDLSGRIDCGSNLGQWEQTVWSDLVYLQSGCKFARCSPGTCKEHVNGGAWHEKYRGFDKGSLSLDSALMALEQTPENWKIHGTTNRFIGFKQALHQNFDTWRRFETGKERELNIGGEGKRRHRAEHCRACRNGIPASEGFHDCALAVPIPQHAESVRHFLPWKDGELLPPQQLADEMRYEIAGDYV